MLASIDNALASKTYHAIILDTPPFYDGVSHAPSAQQNYRYAGNVTQNFLPVTGFRIRPHTIYLLKD